MCSRNDQQCNGTAEPTRCNQPKHRIWFSAFLLAVSSLSCVSAFAVDTFTKPTPEELSMTSLPGYPGAPAVILFREEITKDDYHDVQHYDRIKILTEEGKKYANVELAFVSSSGFYYDFADDKMVGDIVGRTIHADGTIIPFTGKPYLKVLEKFGGVKVQEKVFTLPDVEVGSIIEYRYATRYNDNVYEAPTWWIQDDLYLQHGHFVWYPTTRSMEDEDGAMINSISWFPILPPNAKIERQQAAAIGGQGTVQNFDLDIRDVPPKLKEEYMPPIGSFSYSVRFNFTPYRTADDFWRSEGKRWSKRVNSFASTNNALNEETEKVIAGAATPEEKLRRIYAAVMSLENTEFTRSREKREDKAAGMGRVSDAADVLDHKRGTPKELTELFIAMARSAGFQSYAMLVPDRSKTLFAEGWLNFQQIDDMVAIVVVDGKDQFFDPGSRYCTFGQLAWQHTGLSGLRQTEAGTAFGQTPFDAFKENRTTRVANLTMNAQGEITGKIDLGFYGAPALRWRQKALQGDDEGLKKELRESLESMVPKSLEIEVGEVGNLTDYEKPLTVRYTVKGGMGNSVGKRVMLPADIFLANETATFPHEKRDLAVYFPYTQMIQDAVRVNLPESLKVEAVPSASKLNLPNTAVYSMSITAADTNVTTRRDFVFGNILVMPKDYSNLRTFYSQLESKDQENIVLKNAPLPTTSSVAAPQAN